MEDVEQGDAGDDRGEILTQIRTRYYSGLAFQQFTLNALYWETVTAPKVGPVSQAGRLGENEIHGSVYQHLTRRAEENARGTNPCRYIELPNDEKIHVGHLLLDLYDLVHLTKSVPYTSYLVPDIHSSFRVADVEIASV